MRSRKIYQIASGTPISGKQGIVTSIEQFNLAGALISILLFIAQTTTSSLTVPLKDIFEIQVKCISIIALAVLQTPNQSPSLLPRHVITETHVTFHIPFQVHPKPCGFPVLYSHLLSCQRFVRWCPLVYGTSRHLFHLQMLLSTAHLPSKILK